MTEPVATTRVESAEDRAPLPQRLRRALAVLACVALVIFILNQVGPILRTIMNVIGPFLIALILAYLFYPIVRFVQQKLRLGRAAGILVLTLLLAGAFTGLLVWLIPTLIDQLAAGLHNLRLWLAGLVAEGGRLAPYLREPYLSAENVAQLRELLRGDTGELAGLLRSLFGDIDIEGTTVAQGSVSAVRRVAGGVAQSVGVIGGFFAVLSLVLVIVFFLLMDLDGAPSVIRRLLPVKHRERAWELILKSDQAVGGFLRGQLIVCMAIGGLMSLLLFVIGMREYAILIGVLAGLLNFVPYLGPVAGFLPGLGWILFSSRFDDWGDRGIWLLVLLGGFAVIQAIEGFVLQPLVVGKRATLHPLTVIFALLVGSQAGLGGMIVAVPVAAVIKVFWVELYWKDRVDFIGPPARGPRKKKGKQ